MAAKDAGSADFEEFVNACSPRLLRVAWLLTGDADVAEDLLHTALAKVLPTWARISAGRPEAYVRRVIVRAYADWRPGQWRREVAPGEPPDTVAAGPVPLAGVDMENVLAHALCRLPKRQRVVIVLRHFEGLSVDETAEVLGCGPGTAKRRASRAIRFLPDRDTLSDKEIQGV
ncbi:SigE family RNA polymerase sigma factor [Streptomyces sp. NPDC052721]|uniref:SigE family RNA polymerase sigma factor n=1 Tax=Streptomyces sp. NPDC052721 TaxID=3154955 RepID=UPI0034241B6A